MLVRAQELQPETFAPFGEVIEPRRTGEQFDRSNPYTPHTEHGHVPLVLTNGEPVLRIMHQRLRGLSFGKMARHMRVSQCLGAIGGKDWYLGVAAPGNTVTLDKVAAFHIPGDRIVGVQIPGKGVEVHTIDCDRLAGMEESGLDWVDLSWTKTALQRTLAVGRIIATVENKRGVLAELCRTIADNEGDILNLRMAKRTADFFDMIFDIEVADARHLTNIVAAMRTSKAVKDVERVRG